MKYGISQKVDAINQFFVLPGPCLKLPYNSVDFSNKIELDVFFNMF